MTPTPSLTPTPSVPTTTSSPAIHAVKPTTTPTSQPTLTNTPVPQLSVGVSGTVFSDDNCNGFKDGNESIISNASVTIFYNNPPTYQIVGSLTTDGSGNFSWSKNIYQNDSYPVQISVLSPSGYKSDPKQGAFSLVLNASNPHGSWTIGQVPNADVSSMCNN